MKVLVIGYGAIGRRHVKNLLENTNLEISPDLLILNTDNNFIFNYNNLLNKKYCQIFKTRGFVVLSKNYLKNVKCLN